MRTKFFIFFTRMPMNCPYNYSRIIIHGKLMINSFMAIHVYMPSSCASLIILIVLISVLSSHYSFLSLLSCRMALFLLFQFLSILFIPFRHSFLSIFNGFIGIFVWFSLPQGWGFGVGLYLCLLARCSRYFAFCLAEPLPWAPVTYFFFLAFVFTLPSLGSLRSPPRPKLMPLIKMSSKSLIVVLWG